MVIHRRLRRHQCRLRGTLPRRGGLQPPTELRLVHPSRHRPTRRPPTRDREPRQGDRRDLGRPQHGLPRSRVTGLPRGYPQLFRNGHHREVPIPHPAVHPRTGDLRLRIRKESSQLRNRSRPPADLQGRRNAGPSPRSQRNTLPPALLDARHGRHHRLPHVHLRCQQKVLKTLKKRHEKPRPESSRRG